MVDGKLVNDYIAKTLRARRTKEILNRRNAELEAMAEELKEQFFEDGVSNMQGPEGTAYLDTTIWAGYPDPESETGEKDYDATNQALEAAGLGIFVNRRFNAQTMSAWVREQPRDPETGEVMLPNELKGKLKISEVVTVKVRKASDATKAKRMAQAKRNGKGTK